MAFPQLIFRIVATVSVIAFRSARQAYKQAINSAPKVEMQTPEWAQKLGFGSNERFQEMKLPEAVNILGLSKADSLEIVKQRFEHLDKANDPEKGGSEYLRGKIHCAYNLISSQMERPEITIEQLMKRFSESDNPKKDQL